jgi:hypothetical protein
MLRKSLYILLAAGILAVGMTALAEEEKKQNTIQSQDQVRVTERTAAEVKTGEGVGKSSGEAAMTQERTRTREQKMDATGDQDQLRDRDKDQLHTRDRDRIHDHTGTGGKSGGMGGSR